MRNIRGIGAAFGLAIAAIAGAGSLWTQFFPGRQSCPAHFADGVAPTVDPQHGKGTTMLCNSEFALLHSSLSKTPLWSAEHLTADQVRTAAAMPRVNTFHDEPRLPFTRRAELSDYVRSGYDRGHMVPSHDMSTPKAQNESFSLANTVPQHPCSNQGIWEGIEISVRSMALKQNELYVVTGPVYADNGEMRHIGRGVLVPSHLYKAVYDPVSGMAGAYLVPNAEGASWRAIPLTELQRMTGVNAFPSLPPDAMDTAMPLPPPSRVRHKCILHTSGEAPQ